MGNQTSEPIDFTQPVELRHFDFGRCIGKGAFGKVRIVQKRDSKQQFALKYINKVQCINQRTYRNILRERDLLEKIEHPFVVNLRFAFQDDENMFMVLDLMLGGDLRFHLTKMSRFTEEMTKFYAAELTSALIYLHSRNVVHRDLKPDNILLDMLGHIHITDFNCACILETGKAVISETGTHAYMAPEMYDENVGYRESVDWWALGVTLYELLYGIRPYDGEKRHELIQSVKFGEPEFKGESCPYLVDFMKQLLQKEVKARIGSGPDGPLQVKLHPNFKSIDWDKLNAKKVQPPFIPDPRALNFDARYEIEEFFFEDNPLTYQPRKLNPPKGMSTELQLIEDGFKQFDYSIYERYTGIVDPVKLSVGQPPSWVKCLDPPKQPIHPLSLKSDADFTTLSKLPQSKPSTLLAPRSPPPTQSALQPRSSPDTTLENTFHLPNTSQSSPSSPTVLCNSPSPTMFLPKLTSPRESPTRPILLPPPPLKLNPVGNANLASCGVPILEATTYDAGNLIINGSHFKNENQDEICGHILGLSKEIKVPESAHVNS